MPQIGPRSIPTEPTDEKVWVVVNTQSQVLSRPVNSGPMFNVLEGLGAVGKSTIAPMLAKAIGADYVDTLTSELAEARRHIDAQRSAAARLHFWLMANYLASDIVRTSFESGRSVVMESYFHRSISTHWASASSSSRQTPRTGRRPQTR